MTRPALAELLEATSPETRARQAAADTIPVHDALAPLLPSRGLARGTVVELNDAALLLALAAVPAQGRDVWTAIIDLPDLGLAAARAVGIPLGHVLLADNTGPDGEHFGEVVSTLSKACPLILARPPQRMPERQAARLAAHLRRNGTVLLAHGGHWPGAQLRLDVTEARWEGLGQGWGQLRQRHVTVTATGRGAATRGRTAQLLLPDETGAVRPAVEQSETALQDHHHAAMG
jgi:hypothetical protein